MGGSFFFIENPGGGGGVRRGGGAEGLGGCLRRIGWGGLNFFFSGPKRPPRFSSQLQVPASCSKNTVTGQVPSGTFQERCTSTTVEGVNGF